MNTRLAVSAHILTLLESQAGEPASSSWIAASVNTNPVLVRRLLGQLGEAGLTSCKKGPAGGAVLARAANRITLADVYRATADDADVIPVHASPNPQCPVGRHIQRVLEMRFSDAENALLDELARTTVADLTQEVSLRTASSEQHKTRNRLSRRKSS